ncbi:MAG: hypothetical protein LJE95_11820 [Acidobacteria bacterium]|nr:hypothetical protein [Acidobacteriota bacterium]
MNPDSSHRKSLIERLSRPWLIAIFIGLWVLSGLALIPDSNEPPKTPVQWALWLLVAPVVYVVGDFVASLLARVPPFSWILRWIDSGVDATDRIFRVVVLAVVFLILFFIGLGIYTHLLGI